MTNALRYTAMMNKSYIMLAYSSLFILGFVDNARGPFYPEFLSSFNLLDSQGSYIFSFSSLSSFVASFFAKKWLERFGLFLSDRIFLIIQALSILIFGLSGLYQSFPLMLLASVLFGAAIGGLGVCNNLLVAKGSDPIRLRQFFSGLHSMYGLASIIAPMIAGWVLAQRWPWHNFFLSVSLLALLPLIYSFRVINNVDEKSHDRKIQSANWRLSLLIATFSGFYVASEIVISSRLVIYLQTHLQTDKVLSANYLMYFFIFLLTGRVLVSIRAWRVQNITLLNISVIASILFMLLGLYAHPFFLALTGLSMSYFFPCATSYISSKFPAVFEDIMTKVMIGINLNLFFMHWLFGQISTAYNIQMAMHLSLIYLLVVFILLQKIHRMRSS
jgi:MFS transporter, FHS family, glucose/mannose:H+ symporter